MAKNPKGVEASMREARERAARDSAKPDGPTLAEQFGVRDPSDWRMNMPRATEFYLATESYGGKAHKPAKTDKAPPDQPRVYRVRTACGPDDKTVMLVSGPNGYPLPFEGSEEDKCSYCMEGKKMPTTTEAPKSGRSRRSTTTTAPKATEFTFPTFEAGDPMYDITDFMKTYHDHLKAGVDPSKVQALIPDEMRTRYLKSLFVYLKVPEDQTAGLFNDEPAAAKARLAKVSSANKRKPAKAAVVTEPAPTPEPEATPEPEVTVEPTPEPEVIEAEAQPVVEAETPEPEVVAEPETTPAEDVAEGETTPEGEDSVTA